VALRSLHIFFVDNDPHTHEKIQQALGGEFVVQSFISVAVALARLDVDVPDILISEVVVGREDGLELCRYVRATPSLRYLPVMLLTSRSTLQDKVAGFDAGADDYVIKPFDAHHLQARIRLLSRIKRLEQRLQVYPGK
jgi:DNA-binding response OmpR family regulator